jgi:O-antigen biosynthesis protein
MNVVPRQSSSVGTPSDDGQASISVVMAAYTEDRWDSIVDAVASVLNQSPPPLEMILAVDHNLQLFQRAKDQLPGVTVIQNTGPRGASGARNSGVLKSRGELLVFVDDDQAAGAGWLRRLCGHFADADVLGVGGGITLDWPERRPRWLSREFDWVVGGSYTGMPEVTSPIRNVWSGNMAIRRSVFDAVGGFLPGFGKVGTSSRPEDTDLCLRVGLAFPTSHWLYEPSAEVSHKVPLERVTLRFFLQRCWSEGRGKASLARLNGIDASTAAERQYATKVLPRALFRELGRGIFRVDVASLERAAAIVAGVLFTVGGLLTESVLGKPALKLGIQPAVRMKRDEAPNSESADRAGAAGAPFRPVHVAEWDVLNQFPATQLDEAGYQGGPVSLLVRLGTEPLGCLTVDAEGSDSLAKAAAQQASSFRSQINDRLVASEQPPIGEVPLDGLQIDTHELAFVAERQRLLKDAPAISVVVCTRDRPERIAECVRWLADQDYPTYEIIVVDNAPADPEAVSAALASLDVAIPVRYILEPRGGLSRARNTGWQKASAEIIAFVDDDVLVDRHWLAEILRGFSATSEVGCVTGAVLPAELRTQSQLWFEEFGGFAKGRGFTREVFAPGHPQSPLYPLPQFGAGANMAFRREVLIDIAGFNVTLGGGTPAKGSEDTYAFSRTLLAQHTLVYQPTALVSHYHRETFDELKSQLYGYGIATSAFYGALLAHDFRLLIPMLRLFPVAVRDLLKTDSIRTADMRTFPTSLMHAESRGFILGLPAFVYSAIKEKLRRSEMAATARVGHGCGK